MAAAASPTTPYSRTASDPTQETPYRTLELGVPCGDPTSVNRMVILTDGVTYGDTDRCRALADDASRQGINIYPLGIGSDWDEDLLDNIGRRSGGLEAEFIRQPGDALHIFQQQFQSWAQFLPRFLEFIPGLLGMFLGAPLVARELESGTFRFAWTQGTPRLRWITVKLVLLGAALTLLALAFSAPAHAKPPKKAPTSGRLNQKGQPAPTTSAAAMIRGIFR